MAEKVIRCGRHGKYIYSFRESDGADFAAHVHSYYEFLYVMKGSAYCSVEGSEYVVSNGDMIITKPNELHSLSFPEQCIYIRHFFQISYNFIENMAPGIIDILDSKKLGTFNLIPSNIVKKYRIPYIFDELKEYGAMEEHKPYAEKNIDIMFQTFAVQLVLKLNRIIEKEPLNQVLSPMNKKVTKILEYINVNFNTNITIDMIAENIFFDKSYICKLFKNETGMTIHTYINMRRIMLAKNLMLSGENATDIFEKCGFKDYSTFYRAFQKYVGVTPEKFKSKNYASK